MAKWIAKIERGKKSLRITVPKGVVDQLDLGRYDYVVLEGSNELFIIMKGLFSDDCKQADKKEGSSHPD